MFVRFITFVIFAVFISGMSANAATQSLALLETDEATPFICANGRCQVELSTFCLQKERDLPRVGDPYKVVAGAALSLVLTDVAGNVTQRPAASYIQITAARSGHTAVQVELREGALASLGAVKAAIEIGERVTLMPVAFAGDDNPQSVQDQLLAKGPLRILGARIVDGDPARVETVRILNRLMNALPRTNAIDPGAREKLWVFTARRGFQAATPERIARASAIYNGCWADRLVELGAYSVRTCVQRQHDNLMWDLVKRYWKAVGAGS